MPTEPEGGACPCDQSRSGYGVDDGLAVAVAETDPEGIGEAVGAALADPDAAADPLAAAETLGMGLGLGDGKSVVGTFANERAKIRTNMISATTAYPRAITSPPKTSQIRFSNTRTPPTVVAL